MRIRNYRQGDIPTLVHIQQLAAKTDGVVATSLTDFEEWLAQPGLEAAFNVFVITDDDDELNEWGQAGTTEGHEGEFVDITVLILRPRHYASHFLGRGVKSHEHCI